MHVPTPTSTSQTARGLQRLRSLPRAELKGRLAAAGTCSANQIRLWYSHLLEPHSNAYNVPLICRIGGDVHTETLAIAWTRLLERHVVLRSVLFEFEEVVHQIALDPDSADCRAKMLPGALPSSGAALDEVVSDAVLAPFDLQSGPPARCHVTRLDDGDALLAMVFHHIVVDGWSLRVISDEFFSLLEEAAASPETARPTAPQYAEFVEWQRATVTEEARERERQFWGKHLSDLPRPRSLSGQASGNAPGGLAGIAEVLPFALDLATSDALRAYCRRKAGTPFVALMSALQVLNFRFTGNPRPAIGTTTTGRKLERFEKVVGFFVNTIAVPSDIHEYCSFAEVFDQQKNLLFEAYDNDHVPYEQIVSAIRPSIGHQDALYNWVLELHPAAYGAAPKLTGLRVEPVPSGQRLAKTECSFFFTEREGRFDGLLEYDSHVLDRAGAQALVESLTVLIRGLLTQPESPVGHVPLTDGSTPACSLASVNGPVRQAAAATPADLLLRAAAGAGSRVALSTGAQSLMFDELVARVARLSTALLALVPAPDHQMVAIVADRSVDSYVALLACWCAGIGYLPLNPRDPASRQQQIIAKARVALTLYDSPETFSRIPTGCLEGVPCRRIEGLVAQQPVDAELPRRVPLRTYVIFTSGTTGEPKGCVMSWRSIVNLQAEIAEAVLGLGDHPLPCAVTLNAPLFFDASVQQLMLMFAGCSMYIVPEDVRLDARLFHAFLARHRIQILELTPSHFRLLQGAYGVERLPALRAVMLGAEDIPPDLWGSLKLHPRLTFHNIYGPTECTVDSTVHRIDIHSPRPTIGTPLGNTVFYVVDAAGNLLPRGAIGQLLIAGLGVSDAYYLDRPDITAAQYEPNPFSSVAAYSRCYRTGDLVRMRMSGEIEYLGRMDGQVKVRGNRVEPEEVALAIRSFGTAVDCRVVVEQDEAGTAVLTAYVVPTTPDRIDNRGLERFVAHRVPAHAMPSRFHYVESIPMRPNGKVDLRRLAEASRYPVDQSDACDETLNADEEAVMKVWRTVLRRDSLSADRSFTSLGGHSIQLARMLGMLRDACGLHVSAQTILEGATVREVARLRARQVSSRAQRREPATLGGAAAPGVPLFCIHPLGGSLTPYRILGNIVGTARPVHGIATRVADDPAQEHATLRDMVGEYTDMVRRTVGQGPVHLMGWSLGGLLALSVAQSLTAAGTEVLSLNVWDTGWSDKPEPDQSTAEARFAAFRAVLDALPIPAHVVARAADALCGRHGADAQAWLECLASDHGLDELRLSSQDLEHAVALTLRHRSIIGEWSPPALKVPVHALWAADSLAQCHVSRTHWGRLTGAPFSDEVVPGDHYSIVRQPAISGLAEQLGHRLQRMSRPAPDPQDLHSSRLP